MPWLRLLIPRVRTLRRLGQLHIEGCLQSLQDMLLRVTTGQSFCFSGLCWTLSDNVQAWSMSTGYIDIEGATEYRVHLKVCHKSCSLLSFNNGAPFSLVSDPALLCQGPTHVLKMAVRHTLNNEDAVSRYPTLRLGLYLNSVTVLVP